MTIKQYNYNKFAKHYDTLELKAGDYYKKTHDFLDKTLKKYKVKTVLDMTCGTGAQAITLARKGYKVTASDISKDMLDIAKKKSKGLSIKFYHGDMQNLKVGKFDAVIVIFNAIAHLSKEGFERAIKNISRNLKDKGLFIFDIFNFDVMKKKFCNYEFIDRALEHKGVKYVRFNNNRLNLKNKAIRVNQRVYIQEGMNKPEIHKEVWDIQIYSSEEIKMLLEKNGFNVIRFYDLGGKKFVKNKSFSILVVARKK